ncbi:MAG: TetR family transcriptional regulator [Microscillaceae bacterium]|nr:TetR family transcriptional regulator [Microscillaceae bacterium]
MARKTISEIRRREILEAFYEIARKEGLENTSFAKIAKELEIQPSLIVHYFTNREELILSLIEYNLEQYSKIFQTSQPVNISHKAYLLETIDKIFSMNWNHLFDDGVYYSCYALIFRHPQIKEKFRNLHKQLRVHLGKIIELCKDDRSLRVENIKILADHIFRIIDGTYYYISMLEDEEEHKYQLESGKTLALSLLDWVE